MPPVWHKLKLFISCPCFLISPLKITTLHNHMLGLYVVDRLHTATMSEYFQSPSLICLLILSHFEIVIVSRQQNKTEHHAQTLASISAVMRLILKILVPLAGNLFKISVFGLYNMVNEKHVARI